MKKLCPAYASDMKSKIFLIMDKKKIHITQRLGYNVLCTGVYNSSFHLISYFFQVKSYKKKKNAGVKEQYDICRLAIHSTWNLMKTIKKYKDQSEERTGEWSFQNKVRSQVREQVRSLGLTGEFFLITLEKKKKALHMKVWEANYVPQDIKCF